MVPNKEFKYHNIIWEHSEDEERMEWVGTGHNQREYRIVVNFHTGKFGWTTNVRPLPDGFDDWLRKNRKLAPYNSLVRAKSAATIFEKHKQKEEWKELESSPRDKFLKRMMKLWNEHNDDDMCDAGQRKVLAVWDEMIAPLLATPQNIPPLPDGVIFTAVTHPKKVWIVLDKDTKTIELSHSGGTSDTPEVAMDRIVNSTHKREKLAFAEFTQTGPLKNHNNQVIKGQ